MSIDAITALLSAEGATLTDPNHVERALARMWQPAGRRAGGESAKTATRVCMGNLIVVADSHRWDNLSQTLGELSPFYPARTVVVLLRDRTVAAGGVQARVTALCHIPQPGRPQVCCEQIILSVDSAADDLDRTVLPLLASDVPTTLWWLADVNRSAPMLHQLQSLADRLVLDTGRAALTHLESISHPSAHDLGWYRTAMIREWIAGMVDECPARSVHEIRSVTVTTAFDHDDDFVDAIWVLSFLAGQLGWKPLSIAGSNSIRFATGTGQVDCSLIDRQSATAGLHGIDISGTEVRMSLHRREDESETWHLSIFGEQICESPRVVDSSRAPGIQPVATALTSKRHDSAFIRALPIAAWLNHNLPE